MKTVNKIMVAIDFSDYSVAAAKYAIELARDFSANLLFINVFNQRDIDMMDKAVNRYPIFKIDDYVNENIADRKKRLEQLVKEIDTGELNVELNVCIGTPYEALLKEIEEKKPDLLIMGKKGKTNLKDAVIGSCAQKMFRRSPIPLLTIRE